MGSDAIILGAGPSGLLAASQIASKGFSVKILEEHNQVGVPSHCSGLISVEGLERIGVKASDKFVQNAISGGKIYSPNGQCIAISDARPRAYVVDRAALDQHLAEKALDAGAQLVLGKTSECLIIVEGHVIGVSGVGWSEAARLTVDAEGPSRKLARVTGLVENKRAPLLGVNTEVCCEIDPTIVEVWFGREIAPGFFAWVIPTSKNQARVGLAAKGGDSANLLKKFINKRFGAVPHLPLRAGQVLVDGPIKRASFPGLLIVGDAAGHVKPTTGGGVALGGLCAVEAGKIAALALESDDVSDRSLTRYDETLRRLYGDEFKSMQTIRNLADKISDERMNRFFRVYSKAGLGNLATDLIADGDMDLQGGVIMRALSEPRFIKVAVGGLGRLALAELRELVNL